MDLKLKGDQRQQLLQAIISAYPSETDLEMMVSFKLDENLHAIAGGGNRTQVTFNLIKWAEARGKLGRLILAPYETNPGNQELRDFYQSTIQQKFILNAASVGFTTDIGISAIPILTPTSEALQTLTFEVVTVNRRGEVIKKEPKQAQYFTELGNGITLEMVAIPGGTFLMGSPEGEGYDDEKPQHEVTVEPFFIGKYPVTQAQWRAVAALPRVDRDLQPDPSHFKGDNRPVECISWFDAVEFCARLSKVTGKDYRLPSEAEWEYACRAGTTTPFHFGETITTELANYRGTDQKFEETVYKGSYGEGPLGIYRNETTPVGLFPANAFCLHDMHGNVFEWCIDHWPENYEEAPTNGNAWILGNNDNHLFCLLRGGSWDLNPVSCRSANRNRDSPGNDHDNIGFRVVCGPAQRT